MTAADSSSPARGQATGPRLDQPTAPGGACCAVTVTERRTLQGAVLRTTWHHPVCRGDADTGPDRAPGTSDLNGRAQHRR
ncbi:hypothetical protein [Kitasatospora sp. NPDC002040]|uniref:hypothetical protein n=1 Tax=Kitasatospora sp. NPDC002040 TaxID=3154661 RepID=UPI003318C83B